MSQTNPSPIISTIAAAIKAQMEIYAKPRGGYVKILPNMRHLWEELLVVDEKPRILIVPNGETARGEYAGGRNTNLHRVDRKWTVVMVRGHGFKNMMPGNEVNGIEDWTDSIETVRDGLRVLQGISEEFPNDYRGWSPMPNIGNSQAANVFLDAVSIEIFTAADIPAILEDGTTG